MKCIRLKRTIKLVQITTILGLLALSGCATNKTEVPSGFDSFQVVKRNSNEFSGIVDARFNAPWENPNNAIIIDPYHQNSIDWESLSTDKRVIAIIHKASEGFTKDKKYTQRKQEALKRGYLWGSYHLGRPGDPKKQADFYLNTVKPSENELIALDLENISSSFMSLDDAKTFIEHVKKRTGRYPILYTNHQTTKDISAFEGSNSVFYKTPLWYARFKRKVTDFPKGIWQYYTIWQFSSELNCKNEEADCLYRVPGTKYDMDVNVYYGTAAELKSNWPLTK